MRGERRELDSHGVHSLSRPLEFVAQDSADLVQNRIRNREFDLTRSSEIQQLLRLPAATQRADDDVGVGGDPSHLPPALFAAPFVNQAIHVTLRDAELLGLPAPVVQELLPPAIA